MFSQKTPEIQFRPMTPEDYATVANLELIADGVDAEEIGNEEYMELYGASIVQIGMAHAQPNATFLVATMKDGFIEQDLWGVIGFRQESEDMLRITHLHGEAYDHGVAEALFLKMIDNTQEQTGEVCVACNFGEQPLYQALGFKPGNGGMVLSKSNVTALRIAGSLANL